VAEGRIERTIPFRISADETLDIGEDTGTPVSEDYHVPFRFTGDLKKLAIRRTRRSRRGSNGCGPTSRSSNSPGTGAEAHLQPIAGSQRHPAFKVLLSEVSVAIRPSSGECRPARRRRIKDGRL
jgi:hypothetical protein